MSISSNEMSNISTAYDDSLMLSTIASTSSSNRQYKTTAEKLATLWSIGLDTAIKTIQVTTQKGIRTTTLPIEQRFRTRQAQLRYKQLGGRHGRFYTDTFFSGVPMLNGNSMVQLFTNDLAFTRVYPMKLKSQAHESLSTFIHEVGIPSSLHSDDAKELMQGKFKDLCKEFNIPCTYTEPYSPWQNRAENAIRELKRHVRRKMLANKVPPRLWDFCVKWSSDIRNKTSSNRFVLDGRTPYEAILGHTPDISLLVTFNFYEPLWYIDQTAEFPQPR
jgi:IS30 family transposase